MVLSLGFSGQEFVKELMARGVRVTSSAGPTLIRAVTHLDVSHSEIEWAGQIIIELAQSRSRNLVANSATGSPFTEFIVAEPRIPAAFDLNQGGVANG